MELYAGAVEAGVLSHWREDEPFSLDVHGMSAATAACAVRHALRHEVCNFMSADLKIITGSGRHSAKGVPLLLPRIQRLLAEEFGLRHDFDKRLECDARDCKTCAPANPNPSPNPNLNPTPNPNPNPNQTPQPRLPRRAAPGAPTPWLLLLGSYPLAPPTSTLTPPHQHACLSFLTVLHSYCLPR